MLTEKCVMFQKLPKNHVKLWVKGIARLTYYCFQHNNSGKPNRQVLLMFKNFKRAFSSFLFQKIPLMNTQ